MEVWLVIAIIAGAVATTVAYMVGRNRGLEDASISLWIQGWEAHQKYSNYQTIILPKQLNGIPEQERGSDDTG